MQLQYTNCTTLHQLHYSTLITVLAANPWNPKKALSEPWKNESFKPSGHLGNRQARNVAKAAKGGRCREVFEALGLPSESGQGKAKSGSCRDVFEGVVNVPGHRPHCPRRKMKVSSPAGPGMWRKQLWPRVDAAGRGFLKACVDLRKAAVRQSGCCREIFESAVNLPGFDRSLYRHFLQRVEAAGRCLKAW